jgi:uncharacterized protein (DUF885 family)
MRKFIILSALVALVFANGCSDNTVAVQTEQSDTTFQKISDDFLAGYLSRRPEMSVSLGFHEYDGKATDYSKSAIDSELIRLKNYRAELAALDTTSLSAGMFYDYRILRNAIQGEIFNMEDIKPFTNNPMVYAGALDVSIYAKRNFAPLEDRIRSIIAIEDKAPDIYAQAKINLADSLAKPYTETAVQIAEGSVSFLAGDLIKALKDVKNDTLMNAFKAANQKAIDEIKGFAAWLQKEKLPKAHNHYAIGTAKYQKMLNGEMIFISPAEVLELGLKELKKEQDAFNGAANVINPNKKPVDVYHDLQKEHPVADSLIPHARKNLEAIRQFLIDKNIVTMPSEVRAKVAETPEFGRSTSTASMDTPGPFEKKATEAFYYITPVDPKWTPKQKEDWLSQFDYYSTDNISVHEVYPGHYTQFLHLNASSATKLEKIFGSYAYVEGWAHYTEKMMVDAG